MSFSLKDDPLFDSMAPGEFRPSHTRLVVRRSEPAPESVRNILSLIEEALKASTHQSDHIYIIEEVDSPEDSGGNDNFDFVEIIVTPESGTVLRGKRSVLRAVMAEATFRAEPYRQTA